MSSLEPADPILDIVLPRPKVTDLFFQYNFFVKNESVDDQGEAFDGIESPNLADKPRFIRIEMTTETSIQPADERSETPPPLSTLLSATERANILDIINNEVSIQNAVQLSVINFQDLNVNDKLYNLVQTTAKKRILTENKRVKDELNENRRSFLRRSYRSQQDFVNILRREVPVADDFLQRSLQQADKLNEAFIDEKEQKAVVSDNFEKIKKANFNAKFNSKFVSSCAQSSINDTLGTYSEEILPVIENLRRVQTSAITGYQPIAGNNSVNLSANFLSNRRSAHEPLGIAVNSFKFYIAAYLIEKFEILPDGRVVQIDRFFAEPASGAVDVVFDDKKVAYGKTYAYAVSTIYVCAVKVSLDPPATDERKMADRYLLMSSQRAATKFVDCFEEIPPVAPDNLRISWDQNEKAPLLSWRHPLNAQRDIKKFQVLRRDTIEDPFELLIEYDFNDALVKIEGVEKPAPELIEKVYFPITFHHDKSFDRNREYIYCLRSVDAHGLTSSYGEQLKASYNRFTGKIDVELISTRGAPAQMPNFYLINRLFTPTIKDSNHRRVKIYFDPEYLEVVKNNTDDQTTQNIPIFTYDSQQAEGESPGDARTARYKLQVLNTDLQQTETVDIVISDMRSRNT